MQRIIKILSFFFCIVIYNNAQAQCTLIVDVANLQHVNCPNGGAVGAANIIQANYLNYSWQNITNGQLYNGGGGNGGPSRSDLDAGYYVITASSPFNSSCPSILYSDTFEIIEASSSFQFNPTQACPFLCNVVVTAEMDISIPGVNYTYQFDNNPVVGLPNSLNNQCGGSHTYEVFANGVSCGIENVGISQFAQMNLSTSVTDALCTQLGLATVNITGVGASAVNTYCISTPQYNNYTTIDNVVFIGDNTNISNNTSSICDTYQDYTSQSADVTPGNNYSLNIDLGTCNAGNFALEDILNVYIDWNIDGDFNDLNELVAQINPTQSPSAHTFAITVPVGAIPGQSRMRVVAQNNEYQSTNQANPCDNNSAWFGSTEDYTISINGSVANPVTYLWSDGQSTSTATNLSAGIYAVSITDANGCSATDTAIVNGSANVSVFAGTDQTICNGGVPNNLTASGSSVGIYSWSPQSAFTNPNLQNPSFNGGVNLTSVYTVTFTDTSGCIATDSVTIIANPIPTVLLSAVPNPACIGDDIVLTASTSIPVNRYKFQYNSGSGWINMTNPGFDTINPVTFLNITTTTQFRVKVREDNGCTNSGWSPIITVPINMIVTPPISHN